MIEYTVRVYEDGDKFWYLNGIRHREGSGATRHRGDCAGSQLTRERGLDPTRATAPVGFVCQHDIQQHGRVLAAPAGLSPASLESGSCGS